MIGQKIRRIRKEAGLTQEEFARSLMVSRQQLGRWEKGEARPSDIYLEKISLIYEVPKERLGDDREGEYPIAGPGMDRGSVQDFLEGREEVIDSRPGLYALLREASDHKFVIREDEADYLSRVELQGHGKVDYLAELGRYRERRKRPLLELTGEEKRIIGRLRRLNDEERREIKEFIDFKLARKKK